MDLKLIFVFACIGLMAVCMVGRWVQMWRNEPARLARKAEHQRKLKFNTVTRAHLKVRSHWFFSDRWSTCNLMVIFQENGYGQRRILCEDSDANDYPPIREWLDGGDTATLERQFKQAA